ncbi:50S ribosomal protein L9 [Myxacorys almedinensis]|uniref:Large ribosomal subunit protein bL9 n=1 Tax=Myxacorys almedinensis A TaxID=2690445 RepID=A0A8J7Z6Y2_9CYAN|nr:50S ribosomal protein L9 [Myxacorys almedinensis]NDJ17548.1 50S ribosomal protein L9 [Myxacorys almedinensis A]
MAKRVQLVLNKDVSKLGRLGDLVEVAPGFARNYLIPQGMASKVTPGVLKQVERRRELERQRLAELKEVALTQKQAIEAVGSVAIAKQAGETGAIFGTVTNQDIADAIQQAANQEIDRRTVTLPDVHSLGEYRADIKLHPEVTVSVTVQVVAA